MVTCCRRSRRRSRVNRRKFPSRPAGLISFRCCTGCRPCTIARLSTVTSNVRMCSWPGTVLLSLETWMSARLRSGAYCRPRLAHHTMPAQKSGKISLMTIRVTSGVWGAWFMKCARSSPRSEPTIWTSYSKECARAESHLCQPSTPKTSCTWSSCACSSTQSCGPTASICWLVIRFRGTPRPPSLFHWTPMRIWSWSERFESPEISARSLSACRLQTTRVWTDNRVYRPCDRTIWICRVNQMPPSM